MAKSREKIQQLGFWDKELANPDHDTICLWAYNNADTIFQAVYPEKFNHRWLKNEVALGSEIEKNIVPLEKELQDINERPNPRVQKRTLEYVLRSKASDRGGAERIVGYADLLIETEVPILVPRDKASGVPGGGAEFEIAWIGRPTAPVILVEAKSLLPTLGELMRQIQLYRTVFNGKFVIVSPDDRFAGILLEQGVSFIKYFNES